MKKDRSQGVVKVLSRQDRSFYDYRDVMEKLGVGRTTAYRIIKQLQEELTAAGYLCVPGKVNKRYFEQVYMLSMTPSDLERLRDARASMDKEPVKKKKAVGA